jgi:hypothetical protein
MVCSFRIVDHGVELHDWSAVALRLRLRVAGEITFIVSRTT